MREDGGYVRGLEGRWEGGLGWWVGIGRGLQGGRKMTHASASEGSLISAAERNGLRLIRLVIMEV